MNQIVVKLILYNYPKSLGIFWVLILWLLIPCLSFGQTDSVAVTHKVGLGENLFKISLKYGKSVDDLIEWNNLNSTIIETGQALIVGYQLSGKVIKESGYEDTPATHSIELLKDLASQVNALYYEEIARVGAKDDNVGDTALLVPLFSGDYAIKQGI